MSYKFHVLMGSSPSKTVVRIGTSKITNIPTPIFQIHLQRKDITKFMEMNPSVRVLDIDGMNLEEFTERFINISVCDE